MQIEILLRERQRYYVSLEHVNIMLLEKVKSKGWLIFHTMCYCSLYTAKGEVSST